MASSNWRAKLSLALGATLVLAAVAWWQARKRHPTTTVTARFIETPASDEPAAIRPATVTGASPFARGALRYPASTFRRRALTDDEWRRYSDVGDSKLLERDSHAYFRYRPNIDERREWSEHPRGFFRAQTNSLGLRGSDEVRVEHPNLRILVTGDSHADGVCDPDETFAKVLERELAAREPKRSVEALNAAVGGYSFYHYLGALERYLPLAPDVFVVAVYGGNDFEEGLTLHHLFQGGERPTGTALYRAQFDAAYAIDPGAVVQGFVSAKYFAVHPDQVDVALQMARDVSSEIVATCWRHGVQPIFVYIPPAQDVEWDRRADELERIARELELSPEDVHIGDRMADSFIAFLRAARVDVVDLRETFRTASEDMYWKADYHIDLAAQRAIAAELLPLVEAARPANAVRVRPAAAPSTDLSLLSPGATPHDSEDFERGVPMAARRPLAVPLLERHSSVEAVDRAFVDALFELGSRYAFDERTLFRYAPNLDFGARTNSLGLLSAGEPSDSKPDLRVLFTSDEVVFAPGDEGPACGASIEELLRAQRSGRAIECLDATTAGWCFFQYGGVWERSAELAPDVFVVAVDGANDFVDALELQNALAGRKRAAERERPEPRATAGEWRTCFDAVRRLMKTPAALLASVRAAVNTTAEIARGCNERNARFVLVLVPPVSDLRVQACRTAMAGQAEELGLQREDLRLLERVIEGYRVSLTDPSIELVDFAALVESSDEVLYDCDTLRLSPLGRRRLAEAIARTIAEKLPPASSQAR